MTVRNLVEKLGKIDPKSDVDCLVSLHDNEGNLCLTDGYKAYDVELKNGKAVIRFAQGIFKKAI